MSSARMMRTFGLVGSAAGTTEQHPRAATTQQGAIHVARLVRRHPTITTSARRAWARASLWPIILNWPATAAERQRKLRDEAAAREACIIEIIAQQVFENLDHFAATPGKHSIPVKIKKGANAVLIKIVNGDNPHGFYFALDEGAGVKAGEVRCL